MIGDPTLAVAKLYDMLPRRGRELAGAIRRRQRHRAIGVPRRPDKKIKVMLTYPMSTGRNFDEVLRVLDSCQLTAKHKVATPVNWKQGQDVIIVPAVSDDEAKKTYPRAGSRRSRTSGSSSSPADCGGLNERERRTWGHSSGARESARSSRRWCRRATGCPGPWAPAVPRRAGRAGREGCVRGSAGLDGGWKDRGSSRDPPGDGSASGSRGGSRPDGRRR